MNVLVDEGKQPSDEADNESEVVDGLLEGAEVDSRFEELSVVEYVLDECGILLDCIELELKDDCHDVDLVVEVLGKCVV